MGDPVVHFEIHGIDAESLGTFYSELFGWHASAMPMPAGTYVVVDTHAGSGINGGIATSPDAAPLVTFYVEVDDPQKYLDKIGKHGGTTAMPVEEVPGVVTFAMFADPAGNKVGLVKGGQEGPGVSPGGGAEVSWFEVLAPDSAGGEKLATFYNDIFGWGAHNGGETPGGYVYYQVDPPAGRGIGGGIGGSMSGEPMTTIYARVDDLKEYLERAESLGAKTTMEPMEVGEGTEIAAFTDPQGCWFGLYKR